MPLKCMKRRCPEKVVDSLPSDGDMPEMTTYLVAREDGNTDHDDALTAGGGKND